jgi:hypothetical protein
VGYGDGVEYGPAALATARELAIKEAATDAMKRALTGWGDQFGLILYAKGDEKQRIDRERNRQDTVGEVRAAPSTSVPKSWTEINLWAESYGPEVGWREWVQEAALALFDAESWEALTTEQRKVLGQKAAGAIVALREAHDPGEFPPPDREEVQKAWSAVLGGTVLDGPPWRLSESEEALPTYAEVHATASDTDVEEASE